MLSAAPDSWVAGRGSQPCRCAPSQDPLGPRSQKGSDRCCHCLCSFPFWQCVMGGRKNFLIAQMSVAGTQAESNNVSRFSLLERATWGQSPPSSSALQPPTNTPATPQKGELGKQDLGLVRVPQESQ